ncbi:hypothetical protein BZG36_04366 [Bifiguratus adelaidae]|uniref:Uncharacterized protein n=1 Tax=Bifiguratus adelaidae TaxID=1938954 RepID=A0A261XVZ2_9FUNG|nr:hypothetical protein BZG36_04366 [Bifiguratus adelaidae]
MVYYDYPMSLKRPHEDDEYAIAVEYEANAAASGIPESVKASKRSRVALNGLHTHVNGYYPIRQENPEYSPGSSPRSSVDVPIYAQPSSEQSYSVHQASALKKLTPFVMTTRHPSSPAHVLSAQVEASLAISSPKDTSDPLSIQDQSMPLAEKHVYNHNPHYQEVNRRLREAYLARHGYPMSHIPSHDRPMETDEWMEDEGALNEYAYINRQLRDAVLARRSRS